MIRDEMIQYMIDFFKSTPKDASDYHKMDMLLSRMQRLGMKAPSCGYQPETPIEDNVLINRDKHFNSLKWDETDDN